MGWSTPDVYGQPENFGLEIVFTAEDEYYRDDYGFGLFVVWRDTKIEIPTYYYATDYGCSCPSPFEEFCSVSDLTHGTKDDILRAARGFNMSVSEVDSLRSKIGA